MIVIQPAAARAARAYTGLSHAELGKAAGVAARTVFKFEKDGHVTEESLTKILSALARHGVVLLRSDNGAIKGLEFVSTPPSTHKVTA